MSDKVISMINWERERVFITGAGGFIGSHLAEKLVQLGAKVKVLIRYNSKNRWGWIENSIVKNDIDVIIGDIRDYDVVKTAMMGTDVVFHLAALIGIPYSYISPLAYIKTNVEGTYNVLQAAREIGTKKIIHTSTSEVYGTAQFVPITEEHPINPQSPYAATKASADFFALSFYRSFNLPVAIIRPFNTFGPRQSARAVIPNIISQIISEEKNIKLGSLYTTRDFTFVKDTVEGFIRIAESANSIGEIINFGTNYEVSINSLIKIISKLMGIEKEIEIEEKRKRPEKSEVERLWVSAEKALKQLNWRPRYTLEKGLIETIEWFRNTNNICLYKPDIYNI